MVSYERARSYLENTNRYTKRIEGILERMQRCREQATRITSIATGMPGAKTGEGPVARAVAAYVDLEAELAAQCEGMRDEQQRTMVMLAAMDDERHRQLLEERYLAGYRWVKVAADLSMTESGAYYAHRRALAEFEEIMKKWESGEDL